jgi:hypothetical protein
VADIFISYSKQDQEQARLLAAFLEAEGYSVWWDSSLLSGDNYRKIIMTELGRARATVVIWTENSIHSDWVQSESGRAHADRKLIPVKARGLSYRDIPPPFDNMHIENVDDREKILAAVVALLAKPASSLSLVSKIAKTTRSQLLSWIGILGAVVSLTANLQGLVTLARWATRFVESWTLFLQYAWGKIFFFLPKMHASDALLLTMMFFAVFNGINCSRRKAAKTAIAPRKGVLPTASILIVSLIIIGIFFIGLLQISTFEPSGVSYLTSSVIAFDKHTHVFAFIEGIDNDPLKLGLQVLLFLIIMLLPLIPAVLLILIVCYLFDLRLSRPALSSRLWRIVTGIALLILLNYLSLWLEKQQWTAQIRT